jgi:hypothetical protein
MCGYVACVGVNVHRNNVRRVEIIFFASVKFHVFLNRKIDYDNQENTFIIV